MKLGSSRNQCGACHQYFNSNTVFERHRIGEHGKDRRCMTMTEMEAKGWLKNKDGFWITEAFQGRGSKTSTQQPEATQEP